MLIQRAGDLQTRLMLMCVSLVGEYQATKCNLRLLATACTSKPWITNDQHNSDVQSTTQ